MNPIAPARRAQVARMYREGWRICDIATKLNYTPKTISTDLARIRKDWAAECLSEYREALATLLAKLDEVELKAWESFRLSQNNTLTQKELPDGDIEVTTKTNAAGDARFLSEIQACIDKRAKLMGLYAPEKHDHRVDETVTIVEVLVDNKEDARAALKFDEFQRRIAASKAN